MKRLCTIIVIFLLLSLSTGCGAGRANANPGNAGRLTADKDSSLYLGQDEYGAYQNDAFITSCVELSQFGKRCKFDWISSLYSIPIKELHTKRRIHVGSTLEDIATAYEGVCFSCPMQDLYNEPVEALVQAVDAKKSFEIITWSYFHTDAYMQSEGIPITDEKEIDELILSGKYIEANLTFKIEDGIVTEIILFSKEG